MFVHYRTRGFIFKKEDRGEADQLFTIYTRDFGKLEILGKAIRKISSKLRAGSEIFYLSEIEFIQGKTHKTLTDAVLIEKFEDLKNNLDKLKIAYKVSRTLNDLISGQEPDEEIWQLLKETFGKLNKLEINKEKLELLYYYFFWNLVSLLGYQPTFAEAKPHLPERSEGREMNGVQRTPPRPAVRGSVIKDCTVQGKKINCDIVKIIKVILRKDWQILLRLKLKPIHLKLLKNVSQWYKIKICG